MQDLFLLKRDINAQLYCILYAGCPPLASPQPAHSVQCSCLGLVLPNRSGLCLPCRPFVALPLPLGAHPTFVRLNRASFISHLLAPPPCRAGPFPWLAPWYGMVSHWLSGHFQEYSL